MSSSTDRSRVLKSMSRKGTTVVLVALFLLMLTALTVWAGATFGPVTGPECNPPDYDCVWTVDMLAAFENPEKIVCLGYTVNGSAGKVACQCPACGDDGIGTWTCTLDGPNPDATIVWTIGAWTAGSPGNACGSEAVNAGGGTFTTGPNAVGLATLEAASGFGLVAWLALIGLAVLATALAGGVVLARHRTM